MAFRMVILELALPSIRVNIVTEAHDELGYRKIICRFEQMGDTQGGVLDVRRVEECARVISKLLDKRKGKTSPVNRLSRKLAHDSHLSQHIIYL